MSTKFSTINISICLIIALFINTYAHAEKAKPWTLKDAEGKSVSLSDYQGKPLLLHFWATWCPYCKKIQPELNRLHQKYEKQGLQLLAISWWEDEGAQPQKVLKERGYLFKTLINGDKVAKQYGIKGTPATFFIDKRGEIIYSTQSSDPNNPKLEETVKKLIAK